MNDLPFELFVAVRYLLARRKQAFISLISLISILGVMVGVMALLIALALMTGLQGELRDRIVGSTAHVYVFKAGTGLQDYEAEIVKLKKVPRVLGAAPVVLGQGMITGASGEAFVTLKGIVPSLEPAVTRIAEAMQTGSLSGLDTPGDQMPGIVIGAELATKLGSFVGDTLHVMTPQGTLTPGGMSFAPRRFKVVGLFSLGLLEFDEAYAFMHMAVAERMLGKDRPDFIQLRVDDLFKAQEVADSIVERLGSEYMPQDWADMNQSLFSALSLEKLAISITIGLIVMVAALNIVASLVLLVMEKSRDIAILKTMGSSAASIRRIFMFQGLVIGLVGTLGGAILGYLTIFVADRYKLVRVPVDVYQISYVPFRLEWLDFVVVIGSAVLICFIATIYPSRQAAKLDPAQALRYQ
ncbi:MAG: lipoprotein-releasing ABC transporter permease subunit [Acidobacteria bacterium]|nr:lipoprotein-releasing ABC transporter permease subunit [Acidobacteriota bacterium]